MDYTKLSLLEVSNKIRNREVTSEEVTKQIIERIKETEHLNALNSYCFDEALETAKLVDKMIAEGQKLPSIAGVPVVIKDNINVLSNSDFASVTSTPARRYLLNSKAHRCATPNSYLFTQKIAFMRSTTRHMVVLMRPHFDGESSCIGQCNGGISSGKGTFLVVLSKQD